MTVHLVVEGAKRGGKRDLSAALKRFFGKCLRRNLSSWKITCGGGIDETLNLFFRLVQEKMDGLNSDELVLVVDSDDWIAANADRLVYLQNHRSPAITSSTKTKMHNYCSVLGAVDESQTFFMVQETEAWFLADRASLNTYYLDNYEIELGVVPYRADVEFIEKPSELLKTMTNRYDKVVDAYNILVGYLNPDVVKELPNFTPLIEQLAQL